MFKLIGYWEQMICLSLKEILNRNLVDFKMSGELSNTDNNIQEFDNRD